MNTPSKSRRTAATDGSAKRAPAPEPSGSPDGLDPLRGWFGQGLQAARQSVALMEDLQRLNTRALQSWVESLALAEREADQAGDLSALLALPAQVWNRQLDVWMRQLGEGSQHLLEAELQWADATRTRAQALGLPWWNGNGDGNALASPSRQPLFGAAATEPLAAFGQMQDAWLQLSRRWIDGMAAGGAARG